ncbi:MAG: sulfate adenylyltransferase subunit CysD [Betaproteobacteria bacterium]
MTAENYSLSVLRQLEAESIHILREVAAEFERPVVMHSVGKDSSVLLKLAQKAFAPCPIPIPLLHIDTGDKFPEMYAFRDRVCAALGVDLRVLGNAAAIAAGTNHWDLGADNCCGLLESKALLDALKAGGYDAVISGARRDEERSRAKGHIYSIRDRDGQWDPRNQRPELWSLYNGRIDAGESIRVFPLSNWTELDTWRYIAMEDIEVVPLYFAAERDVVRRGGQLLPVGTNTRLLPGETPTRAVIRSRSLGCYPVTSAVESNARTVTDIIAELEGTRFSKRLTHVIDLDRDGSMEQNKREGYF